MICEKCGTTMKEINSSFSSGMECPNCGWGWVTTNTDAISEDNTNYEIWLMPGNESNTSLLKLIAEIAEVNFLQAKKILNSTEPLKIYQAKDEAVATMPKAKRVHAVAVSLKNAGLNYKIAPEFPYDV